MYHTQFDANKKLWSGITQPPLYHPKISVGRVLLRAMETHQTKVGQIDANTNVEMTYNDIYIKSIRAAQNIQKLNYKKGDVFALLSETNHHFMPIIVGLLCLDYPINPLPPSLAELEVMHFLNTSKPKVIFSDIQLYGTIKKCLEKSKIDAKIFTFGGRIENSTAVEDLFAPTGRENEFISVDVDGEKDIALIMFSSGTTGPSKANALTHANILESLPQLLSWKQNEIAFTFTPASWLGGLLIMLRSILYGSTFVFTIEPFSTKSFVRIIERYRVSVLLCATYQWLVMLKSNELFAADLSSIKDCSILGSKLPLEAKKAIKTLLPDGQVSLRYGLSEMSGTVAINFPYTETESVGKLVTGTHVKIVDYTGKRLGVGEDGEIFVRKTYDFGGYYDDQKTTDAHLDTDGFFQTGDIGRFDEDGFLFLVDRKKEIIICRGSRVPPATIEGILMENPKIKSVCVVGIDDPIYTELPTALVVRNNSSDIKAQEIYDIIANKCRDIWKLRGGVYFVDSLPVTKTGKFIRRQVKTIATDFYKQTKNQKINGI